MNEELKRCPLTETERLRRLLDERGVKWEALSDEKIGEYAITSTRWRDRWGNLLTMLIDDESGMTWDFFWLPTPEQAVEATLGRSECKLHECEGSFAAVNRPVWCCDCGAFVTQYTDATTYHKPRYCPNCGRKVVDK